MIILEQRKHKTAGCSKEYIPVRRHAPLPPNYVENIKECQDWVMQAWRSSPDLSKKKIPPPLKICSQTHPPLPVYKS